MKNIMERNIYKIGKELFITSDEEIEEGDWFYDLDTKYVKIKQSWENSHLDFNGKKIILTTDQDLINNGVQAIDDEFLEWFVNNPSCEYVEVELKTKQLVKPYDVYNEIVSYYKIIIPKEEPKQLTDLEIAIKLEEIEREEVRAVNRTDLYNSILSIVKQIPRENVESDAMDAPSCAYEIEQLFYKWQEPKQETTLDEAAEKYAKMMWGVYYDDIHPDIAITQTQGEITAKDFIAGTKWQQEKMYSELEVLQLLLRLQQTESYDNLYDWFEQFKKK